MRSVTRRMSTIIATVSIVALPALAAAESEHERLTPPYAGAPDDAQKPGGESPKRVEQTAPSMSDEMEKGSESGATYVVQEGDTLETIAEERLGSRDQWKRIARANGIDDPASLRVGQELVIPGGSAADRRSQL